MIVAEESLKQYLHSPAHLFRPDAVYMVTAGTYNRDRWIRPPGRKKMVKDGIDLLFAKYEWHLIAWAVMDNHYHLLARAPASGADTLSRWTNDLHKFTARRWNAEDHTPGRVVWYEYWDRCIDNEASFRARFNYVHWNPVKHGYVELPDDYEYSSYREYFAADNALLERWRYEYPWDRVSERDDF